MSEVTTIARPYAKAAFDFAVEQKAVDSWLEMLVFAAEVSKDSTLQQVIHSSIAPDQLAQLFIQICGEQLNEYGHNLIKVMAENGRLSVLPDVLVEFTALKAELDKEVEAVITSAAALSDAEKTKIQKSLENRYQRKVRLTCQLDPSLMAGLVIKIGDDIIDASVRSKLTRLAEALQS
ncbi:MAG: F0F1 ATP synthase subunit delta [Tolumonas sp.]|jgi:F-type H+-transporting ATPase subunit delta|nr:F0F1 ATP synthase subunit delta [Tolumonas sp.]TXH62610.1 MAG: F0F1 ATP synthase subunit delta [Tolumonas sp.]